MRKLLKSVLQVIFKTRCKNKYHTGNVFHTLKSSTFFDRKYYYDITTILKKHIQWNTLVIHHHHKIKMHNSIFVSL